MADNEEQGSEGLSTDESSEPIELPFEERVMLRLEGLTKEVRDANARSSGVQSISDRNTAELNALRTDFTEQYGTSKKVLGLFERFVRDTRGEEEWAKYEEQQELEDLRASAKAPKEPPRKEEPPQDGLQERRIVAFHGALVPEAKKLARKLGLLLESDTFVEIFDSKFRTLKWGDPTEGDPLGSTELWEGMEGVIRQEVTRSRKAATPRSAIAEITRGTGGGDTTQARYDAWLKGAGPKPSSAEIDSLTAPYLTRT